ncbi:MAG TPA: hypothetical protein VHW24_01095 [Bryobacteraceae bacterium]|nr:hypothetical protein [Bryobacteraceae bacterium]
MQDSLDDSIWPESHLTQLVSAMAKALHVAPCASRRAPQGSAIAAIAKAAGLHTCSTELWGARAESIVRNSAPALLHIEGRGWLAILDAEFSDATLLRSDLSRATMPVSRLTFALVSRRDGPYHGEIESTLAACAHSSQESQQAIGKLLRERLRCTSVAAIWPLQPIRRSSLRTRLAAAPIWRHTARNQP